jgi:hypothetical protein
MGPPSIPSAQRRVGYRSDARARGRVFVQSVAVAWAAVHGVEGVEKSKGVPQGLGDAAPGHLRVRDVQIHLRRAGHWIRGPER